MGMIKAASSNIKALFFCLLAFRRAVKEFNLQWPDMGPPCVLGAYGVNLEKSILGPNGPPFGNSEISGLGYRVFGLCRRSRKMKGLRGRHIIWLDRSVQPPHLDS